MGAMLSRGGLNCEVPHGLCPTSRFCCGRAVLVRILGAVFGEEFPAVLAAAQEGSEAAFTRLWLDANPALLRYLRVIAPESAEDAAAETWVQVVRGLRRFRGGEAVRRGGVVNNGSALR